MSKKWGAEAGARPRPRRRRRVEPDPRERCRSGWQRGVRLAGALDLLLGVGQGLPDPRAIQGSRIADFRNQVTGTKKNRSEQNRCR